MMFAAIYALAVGFSMIGMWSYCILRKQVPEFETEPLRISFHIAGEFITSVALMMSGFRLLLDTGW